MQTKKKEIENKLLEVACEEFLNKGFKAASIRNIVKASGTTIGNFYNYFSSKEDIFVALTKEVYESFVYFLENHHDESNIPITSYDMSANELKKLMKNMVDNIASILNERFLLLVACSKGTKYEGVKEKLIVVISENFEYHFFQSKSENVHKEMGRILATQFICGIVEILSKVKNKEKQRELLVEQFVFYTLGTSAFLK